MQQTISTSVKERPILFSGAMVRAILSGTKTQTRRVIKVQPPRGYDIAPYCTGNPELGWSHYIRKNGCWNSYERFYPPYGKIGDRLWVRETFLDADDYPCHPYHFEEAPSRFDYRADFPLEETKGVQWKPSIFMPRDASRINLEITNIRVERLQDISEEDAKAEGVEGLEVYPTVKGQFARRWEKIYGKKHPWSSNPWVWCISFNKL